MFIAWQNARNETRHVVDDGRRQTIKATHLPLPLTLLLKNPRQDIVLSQRGTLLKVKPETLELLHPRRCADRSECSQFTTQDNKPTARGHNDLLHTDHVRSILSSAIPSLAQASARHPEQCARGIGIVPPPATARQPRLHAPKSSAEADTYVLLRRQHLQQQSGLATSISSPAAGTETTRGAQRPGLWICAYIDTS
jgi:hypothetical protein